MKYVIFSDIHGNGLSFKAFLQDIKKYKYDQIIFLGDFIGYYYDAEEIISYCIDHQVKCLLGNHDSYFLAMLEGSIKEEALVARYGHSYTRAKEFISKRSLKFLESLKSSLAIDHGPEGKILFCHGSPTDPLNGRIYPDTDLAQFEDSVAGYSFVVSGHTHHKMQRYLGDTVFINPGSLGQQRDGLGCSYTLLSTADKYVEFKVVDYNISELESQIDKYDQGRQSLKEVLRRQPRGQPRA